MKKVKLEFQKPEMNSIGEHGGKEIFVQPYIPYIESLELISKYLETYFMSDKAETDAFISGWNFLGAEQEFLLTIIDRYTNIQVFDKNDNLVLDWDGLLESQLDKEIKLSIANIDDVENMIFAMVENVKSEMFANNSFAKALENASETLTRFISGLSDIEMTEEGLGKIAKEISNIGNVLSDSPISALIEDSNRKTPEK